MWGWASIIRLPEKFRRADYPKFFAHTNFSCPLIHVMEKKVTIPEQKRIKSARSCVKEKITKTESTIRKTKTTTLGNQKRGMAWQVESGSCAMS